MAPQQIDEALSELDYERIHKAMVATNWKWAFLSGEGMRTPSVPEIKKYARESLERFLQTGATYSSCGGFTCRRYPTDTVEICFELDSACL